MRNSSFSRKAAVGVRCGNERTRRVRYGDDIVVHGLKHKDLHPQRSPGTRKASVFERAAGPFRTRWMFSTFLPSGMMVSSLAKLRRGWFARSFRRWRSKTSKRVNYSSFMVSALLIAVSSRKIMLRSNRTSKACRFVPNAAFYGLAPGFPSLQPAFLSLASASALIHLIERRHCHRQFGLDGAHDRRRQVLDPERRRIPFLRTVSFLTSYANRPIRYPR